MPAVFMHGYFFSLPACHNPCRKCSVNRTLLHRLTPDPSHTDQFTRVVKSLETGFTTYDTSRLRIACGSGYRLRQSLGQRKFGFTAFPRGPTPTLDCISAFQSSPVPPASWRRMLIGGKVLWHTTTSPTFVVSCLRLNPDLAQSFMQLGPRKRIDSFTGRSIAPHVFWELFKHVY
jgi:hypothetical protein